MPGFIAAFSTARHRAGNRLHIPPVNASPSSTTSGNSRDSACTELFRKLPELQPGVCAPYAVPASGPVEMGYRGLPYDLLEDVPHSGAWRRAASLLLLHNDIATGRPITPLHGGHVGLLCTEGLFNGVFGEGDGRHIACWRSVKHGTTFIEEDGDAQIVHHRERWTNELRLVYEDRRTLKLSGTPARKEEETDGEHTPAARAA